MLYKSHSILDRSIFTDILDDEYSICRLWDVVFSISNMFKISWLSLLPVCPTCEGWYVEHYRYSLSCNTPLQTHFKSILQLCFSSCQLAKIHLLYIQVSSNLHVIPIRIYVFIFTFIILMFLFRTSVVLLRYDIHILWVNSVHLLRIL